MMRLFLLAAAALMSGAASPIGMWQVNDLATLQIFRCAPHLCGRIAWVSHQLDHDWNNPDPNQRSFPLCHKVIIWGLTETAPNHWQDGHLYDPRNGTTYHLSANMISDDEIKARVYRWLPLASRTMTLTRIHDFEPEPGCKLKGQK